MSENSFGEKCLELNQSGRCKADCCGCFPMDRSLFEMHRDTIQVHYEDKAEGLDQAFPVTDDLRCVFIDRETWSCKIHALRPDVCRKMGDGSHPMMTCPRLTPEGDLRTRAERKRIYRSQGGPRRRSRRYAAASDKRGARVTDGRNSS